MHHRPRLPATILTLALLLLTGLSLVFMQRFWERRAAQHPDSLVITGPDTFWDHGSGQNCADCHDESTEEPPELDLRAIPDSADRVSDEGEEGEEGPAQRMSFFLEQRAYPLKTLPQRARLDAWRETQAMTDALDRSLGTEAPSEGWVQIGPAPMKNSTMGQQQVDVSGRVKALVVDPRNSNIVYLGAAQGGVWKTTNGGNSWTALTDDQPSLAIGALAIDPLHPDTIYAGTGEPVPAWDGYYGAGVLKSTNGGDTWQQLGASEFGGLGIASIAINPQNSSILYVASSLSGVKGPSSPPRGIFRSTNGGQSWTAMLTCQDCRGASDLVIDVRNPNVLYAAFWQIGILKSEDGGVNWVQLGSGLPNSNFGRIELAIGTSNPSVLYAGYHYVVQGQYDGAALFRTTNGGHSWTWLQQTPNYCGGQCWYDNVIAVDPTNPDIAYLGGQARYEWQPVARIQQVVIRSSDGGQTWQDMSPNDSPAHTLHPDMHAIAIDPQNHDTVWVGNDGGVWKSTDGGRTWVNRNTNLATLQFVGVALHPTNSSIVFGGMQDNNKAKSSGALAWQALDAGDGGYAAIDPFDTRIYYGSRCNISFQRNDNSGSAPIADWPVKTEGINQQDRALFYPRFALDRSTAGVLYYGTYRLYRTADRGEQWSPISSDLSKGAETNGRISTIAVAPSAPGTIYVGTSDGNVQVTANTGGSWTNATKAPLPNRFVSSVAVAASESKTAYVAFNGFNSHTPGTPGHVFKTTDRGASWRNISGNLPDVPVLSLVLDRDAPGTLYIGTDVGIFRSLNDGQSWQPFNEGLPNVSVSDLALDPDANVLVAGTHGRSVYRLNLTGPQPTSTPTRTPTVGTPVVMSPVGYLPLLVQRFGPGPATSTSTPTRPPTATPTTQIGTPTPTATIGGTVLPSSTPSPTPSITPTPTPTRSGPTPTATEIPSPRVFFDDFSNPASGWETGTSGACESGYVAGEFGVAVSTYNMLCLYGAPVAREVTNGTYRFTAHRSEGWDGSVYGLAFGLDDPQNALEFYIFWVDPDGQAYLLQKYDQGAWSTLVNWTWSAAIYPGDGSNALKVTRQGARISLTVNDVLLGAVDDDSFLSNGYVGLANWAAYTAASAIALFDDFEILEPTVILYDDFSDPSSGWPVGEVEACQAAYGGGAYQVATEPDYACVYRSPGPPLPSGLFEVAAAHQESIYPTAYGVLLGETDDFSRLYVLWINADSQEYVLALFDDGWWALTWDELQDDAWTYSPDIRPGMSVNTLHVLQEGADISLWVNDGYLETITDATFAGGHYGLANWASDYAPAASAFDDFKVTAWAEPLPAIVAAQPPLSGSRPAACMPLPGRMQQGWRRFGDSAVQGSETPTEAQPRPTTGLNLLPVPQMGR